MGLEGVRVLDLTRLLPGAVCSLLLADMGADVIKVEEPGSGDYMRWYPPLVDGQSALFNALNRNKRSLTLNLRSDEGRAIFWELLATADVFIDGFANDACDKLGVGYDEQVKVNPDIVYCQSNGFGVKGPYGPIPVHGYMMGAVAGALPLGEDEDGLVRQVQPAADSYFSGQLDGPTVGAIWAVVSALAALQYRNSSRNWPGGPTSWWRETGPE